MFNYKICLASQLYFFFLKAQFQYFFIQLYERLKNSKEFILKTDAQVPGDMAELHSDTLGHAPLFRKHTAVLLLIVHELTLYPCVAPVNLIQPCHLHLRYDCHNPDPHIFHWESDCENILQTTLTSWFSWKSTRYSERCCLINFLIISCLMRGSRTLATQQASLSTMLGPPGLYYTHSHSYYWVCMSK